MHTLWRNIGWLFSGILAATPFIVPIDDISHQVVAERDWRPTYHGMIENGKIIEITRQGLRIEKDDGETHAFEVASHSMILLDGSFAYLKDLQVGHHATVIAQRVADRQVADQIDAVTQHRIRHTDRLADGER